MRSSLFVHGLALIAATAQGAYAQDWCAVPTAKPYSRNMPGISGVAVASVRRASAPIENFPQNSYVLAPDTVTLTAGESYTFTITHTRDSVAFPRAGNNIRVWIDYDRDGTFSERKELAVTGDALAPGVSTFSFTVPRQTAPVSGTRMRVTAKMSTQTGHSIPTPCDEPRDGFGYHGEIEDYPVNILKAVPREAKPPVSPPRQPRVYSPRRAVAGSILTARNSGIAIAAPAAMATASAMTPSVAMSVGVMP
jgi:hypothetical protein